MNKHLIEARTVIADLMDRLKVKQPEKALDNAACGFFTSPAATGQLLKGEERATAFVCLEADPSIVVTTLLGIISGTEVADLRVAPYAFPSLDAAAGDIWRAPLVFYQPEGLDLNSLEEFAAKMANRGIESVFIDAPCAVSLSPKKPRDENDFSMICKELYSLARRHQLCLIGGHKSKSLVEIAALVDQAVRIEDLRDTVRIGVLKHGEKRPQFTLAKREACGRISDVTRYPWDSSAGKLFAKARKG